MLIAIATLAPLGAFAVMQARLDALVQDQTRHAIEAFRVAESGLAQALADLAADPRFERLGAGPDGRPGTGDDAEYPFAVTPPAYFPRPPFHYIVRVAPAVADRVDLIAWGFGSGTAVHALGTTVLRDPQPYVAAALGATAPLVELTLGAAFQLVGETAPNGPTALAVARDDVAMRLRAALAPNASAQVIGAGGSPSIGVAALPDLPALLGAAQRRADAQVVGGVLSGAIGHGLFVSAGSVRLADVSGDGMLVVGGTLEMTGTNAFAGLVVALGDLRLSDAATATITGAALAGGALVLQGGGEVRYDRTVIERLGSEFGALLPHRVRVTGWREWPEAAPS